MTYKQLLKQLDWALLIPTVLLLSVGLLILFAINFKDPSLAQDFDPAKQVGYVIVGLVLMALFARLDFRVWQRGAKYWYVAAIILLLAVLVSGRVAHGATRSLDLGLIQFQPAEVAKLGIIMALAGFFNRKNVRVASWRYLGGSLLLVGIPGLLIMIQPDLGSSLVVGFIWLAMIIISQVNKKYLLLLLALGLILMPLIINNLHDYQRQRIHSFINPQSDPQGAGYNVVQSTIAVGSGGWLGRGLGSGTQSQLNFLPSQHTDFVFAVLAEKLGFVGASAAVALFGFWLSRMLIIARASKDFFAASLALGIAAMFLIHVVINIGMNLGLAPVTGIPLPLISYGGTNLIVSLIAIGILQSIRLHKAGLEFSR